MRRCSRRSDRRSSASIVGEDALKIAASRLALIRCMIGLPLWSSLTAGLRREDVGAEDINLPAALSPTILLVLALVLGVAVPAVNYWALLLLFLSGPIESLTGKSVGDG
jgi:hypothetical protein